MSDREDLITKFLATTDWSDATRRPLAGDASNRRYERLAHRDGKRTAVLMDAPPSKGEDVRPFIHIAEHLQGAGLSAPKIIAADTTDGLLVLEDLGDALFARAVSQVDEFTLYRAAADVLVLLHKQPVPDGIKPYLPLMGDLAALAYDWYLSGTTEGDFTDKKATFLDAIRPMLATLEGTSGVLILRDYHAENLLWLPDRDGPAQVGLLDFQDAMIGHPAYDLLSLTEDARRDVSPDTRDAVLAHYVKATGFDADQFKAEAALVSAQRNLRILGVFARLSLRDGKPGYIDFIPRVWANLQHDLSHPSLAGLASIVNQDLPEPDPKTLQKLRDKCATRRPQ